MPRNVEMVQKGISILHPRLAEYVCLEILHTYGDDAWWQEVKSALSDQLADLRPGGGYGELVDSLDFANCIRLFDRRWNEVFRKKLSKDYRTWANELMGVRNKVAHIGGADFDEDYAWRALDTMSRLCDGLDAPQESEELRSLARELRYGSAQGSMSAAPVNSAPAEPKHTSDGVMTAQRLLPSWRTIMVPHPDVAQGRYTNAEFAANLAQVAKGEGPFEYLDPVEFFSRTYVTDGMKGLMVRALKRLCGLGGDPVIQLKTAFGGGKTHSMLALYHLLRGRVPVDKLTGVRPILDEAGISELVKVHTAVLVGTALNPSKSRRPQNMPGITINTLWGEMAAQLAASAGKPELYDYVKEADKKGVSPGHEALRQLMDGCGPCLILMDELVAYAKKLYGANNLPAGSFDNFISFIQEITEAACTSRCGLVVASIPESQIEIGGEAGKIALAAIEHTFGRTESVWKPVGATEGFEVVRRRLFLDCKDPDKRDEVCAAFSRMYSSNPTDFPVQAREAEYRERMKSCYPIHPEVFDHLYEEWSTLDKFQRTRGVLRLMAAVIHELWMNNDASAMIMPGSIPLDVPVVRDELTRYLSEEWNGIVDSEVDGRNSAPYRQDTNITRYGDLMASRRLARTIMLGSAPSKGEQGARGIEVSRIRLGTIQPNENIAVFNDALNTLKGSLSYLYTSSSGDHYWYDTRPTLRKTVEDRAKQFKDDDVYLETENMLRRWRKEAPFAGLHVCPSSSLDVPDEQAVRLVVLNPRCTHRGNAAGSAALAECNAILNNRGAAPRNYKNMLVFLAPDAESMQSLNNDVRRWMAWRSILEDRVPLNLDAAQEKETRDNISRLESAVKQHLEETYCWLLSPYIDLEADKNAVAWEEENIRGGSDTPVSKARRKLEENEALITHWAPSLLLMKLDGLLWRDANEIQIKKLWGYFCTYCYLPRLAGFSVLEECIRTGVNSKDYFAYAEGVSDGRYLELKYNTSVYNINDYDCLVKLQAALKQLVAEKSQKEEIPTDRPVTFPGERVATPGVLPEEPSTSQQPEGPKNTHFFLTKTLNYTRINKDVNDLVQEVIAHLYNADSAEVKITLDVDVDLPNGTPMPVIRTVTENCRTLKVDDFGFND